MVRIESGSGYWVVGEGTTCCSLMTSDIDIHDKYV